MFVFTIVRFFIISFIAIQWILPVAKVAIYNFNDGKYLISLEKIIKLSIPNLYLWLLMFYSLFHCMLNFMAEITYFGDRQFYKDWWNSSDLGYFWRSCIFFLLKKF